MQIWRIEWVGNDEKADSNFIAMRTQMSFKLRPLGFDIELSLKIFEGPGDKLEDFVEQSHYSMIITIINILAFFYQPASPN